MATNKLVTVEQLDRAVDGFAAEVKAADFEKKANLKALAYVDKVGSAHVSSSLSTILAAKMNVSDAQSLVAGEVGMAYRPGGSYAFANLPEPSASNYGVVYHVTDDFVTDARFSEGAGKSFSSGSEVGVIGKTDIISLEDLQADLSRGLWVGQGEAINTQLASGEYENINESPTNVNSDDLNTGDAASIICTYTRNSVVYQMKSTKQRILINIVDNYLAISLSENTWLKNLRFLKLDSPNSTNSKCVIIGEVVKAKPSSVYIYNVFSGFIDTTKFASQSSFTTFKAALDELEVATSSDIQNLIDGLSLDEAVVLAAGTYDANGDLLKTWDQLVADGDFYLGTDIVDVNDGYPGTETYSNDYVLSSKYSNDDSYDGEKNRFAGVSKIVVPNTTKAIKERTFMGCQDLKEIVLPEGLLYIGFSAFSGNDYLSSVFIPDSVVDIGSNAFGILPMLTSIKLPNSINFIRPEVFRFCTGLKSVIIPEGLTTINYGAFGYCESLEEITIPNSVISILDNGGMGAFDGCTNLTTIHYSGTATGAPWGATNATVVP